MEFTTEERAALETYRRMNGLKSEEAAVRLLIRTHAGQNTVPAYLYRVAVDGYGANPTSVKFIPKA